MDSIPRRQALKTLGIAGAGALMGVTQADAADAIDAADAADAAQTGGTPIVVAGTPAQLIVESVSRQTVRVSLLAASSIACAAGRARIACARTAAGCRCPG
jgi:hypothetical protein